jgi:hypothetical protein
MSASLLSASTSGCRAPALPAEGLCAIPVFMRVCEAYVRGVSGWIRVALPRGRGAPPHGWDSSSRRCVGASQVPPGSCPTALRMRDMWDSSLRRYRCGRNAGHVPRHDSVTAVPTLPGVTVMTVLPVVTRYGMSHWSHPVPRAGRRFRTAALWGNGLLALGVIEGHGHFTRN